MRWQLSEGSGFIMLREVMANTNHITTIWTCSGALGRAGVAILSSAAARNTKLWRIMITACSDFDDGVLEELASQIRGADHLKCLHLFF